MFHFFRKKKIEPITDWPVDMHSHLIPGVDDGSKSPEESVKILQTLRQLGMKKWITTPHIFYEYYRNNDSTIKSGHDQLLLYFKNLLEEFDIRYSAEYYFDEHLHTSVLEQKVLTFGDRFLLFETNMYSEPLDLDDFIFKAGLNGYRLVMAHPERYHYLTGNFKRIEELRDKGVYMQVNMLSYLGYYSNDSRRMAREMTDLGLVDFLGSDCHNQQQADLLSELAHDRNFINAVKLNLLNYSL